MEKKENHSEAKEPEVSKSLKELIAVFSGLFGLFIAILWVAGRMYIYGFFRVFNIPAYLVTFSTWEYAERSWTIYAIFIVGFFLLLAFIRFYYQGKGLAVGYPEWLYDFFIRDRSFLLTIVVMLIMIVISASLIFAYHYGKFSGRSLLEGEGYQVDIISKEPLNFGTSVTTPVTLGQPEITGYIYEDFKLITFNEGRYFLFNEIDPEACRPIEVYVVEESILSQVNLSISPSTTFNCTP